MTRRKPPDYIKQMRDACDFPENTCPVSRHVADMAEAFWKDGAYPFDQFDRDHIASSFALTVAALWEARTKIRELEAKE